MLVPFLGSTRLEGQHPDVFPGSPLALIAILVEVLRERFRGDNARGLPFYWEDDPTQRLDEEHTDDSPRKISIESQYLQHPDGRDFRPALLVERGETVFQQLVMGNRAEHDIPTSADLYVTRGITPMSVQCVSTTRGESANLGDIVGFYLLATQRPIIDAFGLVDLSSPVISATQVWQHSPSDTPEWSTTVTLQVTAKYIWRTIEIAPKLREISATLKGINAGTITLR